MHKVMKSFCHILFKSQRVLTLLFVNTVLQAPAFHAARSDEKEKAVAVKEFSGLERGLCATDYGICERRSSGHWGYYSWQRNLYPRECPQRKGVAHVFT